MLGPARSLAAMFYGPLKAIPGWDLETAVLAVLALIGFGGAALADPLAVSCRSRTPRAPAVAAEAEALEIGAAGLAMLVLGYALAFTHFPPNAIVGRGTSVHLGATLGMSVLAAAVAWLCSSSARASRPPCWPAYLALAVGYYVTIERDFMHSWQLQRAFWQQVAACCSDLQDGTVLLYELNPSDEPTFIFTNSWADPLILDETFAFPSGWAKPPRLFSLTQWLDRVEPEGDHLRWWVPGASWDEHWEVLPQANVILLRRGPNGALVRVTGSVDTPAARPLQLKPPAAAGRLAARAVVRPAAQVRLRSPAAFPAGRFSSHGSDGNTWRRTTNLMADRLATPRWPRATRSSTRTASSIRPPLRACAARSSRWPRPGCTCTRWRANAACV